MRMLVVEDEKDLNSIICSKLVKEGYNVDACYDGQAALDFIEMTEHWNFQNYTLEKCI